jgi:hypothetical protein
MTIMDELMQLGVVEPPRESVLEHAGSFFLQSIDAELPRDTTRRNGRGIVPRHASRTRLRPVASVVAVGAVAVAVLLFALNGPSGATPAAASELNRLARISLTAVPVQLPGPGQYVYTKSIQANQDCWLDEPAFCYLLPEIRQVWIASDGSGRLLETYGKPAFYTAQYAANWRSIGSPSLSTPSDSHFGPGGLSLSSKIAELSTDPTQLASQISTGAFEGVPASPVDELEQIGDILRESDASPALQTACLNVIATISGVALNRSATDAIGRHGYGFELTFKGDVVELIFDPSTGAFLGEKDWVIAAGTGYTAGWPAGSILNWTASVAHGLVNSDSSSTGAQLPG